MVQVSERPILLVTRPGAGAERFAARFRERFGADWPIVLSPLVAIQQIEAELPAAEALVFTSQHAVSAFQALEPGRGRTAYCVGQRTADAAQMAGFVPVTGEGDGAALADLIEAAQPRGPLLFARGETVAFDMAKRLDSAGIETKESILYRQIPVDPSPEMRAALGGRTACLVPLFSPNAARRLCEILPMKPPPLFVAAMSAAVAKACESASSKVVEIASQPDEFGMLDALAALLRKQKAG